MLGFEHDHLEAGIAAKELISCPQAGEAAADDAHISLADALEGRTSRLCLDLIEPERRPHDSGDHRPMVSAVSAQGQSAPVNTWAARLTGCQTAVNAARRARAPGS